MGDGISGTMALTQGMLDDLIWAGPPHTHTHTIERVDNGLELAPVVWRKGVNSLFHPQKAIIDQISLGDPEGE